MASWSFPSLTTLSPIRYSLTRRPLLNDFVNLLGGRPRAPATRPIAPAFSQIAAARSQIVTAVWPIAATTPAEPQQNFRVPRVHNSVHSEYTPRHLGERDSFGTAKAPAVDHELG